MPKRSQYATQVGGSIPSAAQRNRPAAKFQSPELDTLHLILLKNQLGVGELAGRLNMKPHSLYDCISRGLTSPYTRACVEAALGFEAIWSSPNELALRKKCLKRLGFDPALLPCKELRNHFKR